MSAHNIAEASTNLPDLIDRALSGEGIVITRDGKPVAELRPLATVQNPATNASAEDMLSWLREGRPALRQNATEDAGTFISKMRDEEWDR
jgi:antitoxin (DNA-binding transcriptional repressor) of toxin-antitoxin stability system